MSEILARARKLFEQQQAELKKLGDVIRQYEQAHQFLTERVGSDELPPDKVLVVPASDMFEKIERILVDAGKPMSGSEILHALNEVGIEITGKNPLNNLSTRLSREAARPDSRIKSNGRGQGYYVVPPEKEEVKRSVERHTLAALLAEQGLSSGDDDSPI